MFMNFFRIAGDMCHLLSFVVMFWKLRASHSCAGVSLKTQELYAIVFVARYLDLFWNFLSIYNWIMKESSLAWRPSAPCISSHAPPYPVISCRLTAKSPQPYSHQELRMRVQVIFIISSITIVYIMRFGIPHKDTYNKDVSGSMDRVRLSNMVLNATFCAHRTTHSRMHTWSCLPRCSESRSIWITLLRLRCAGPSRFTWKLSPSCLNSLCSKNKVDSVPHRAEPVSSSC